jgi:hypothetical protein
MRTLNLIQMIFEIVVAVGYVIGLVPFGYIFVFWWLIPLTIANLVFSVILRNGTLGFTITNVIMAFLSLIPIVGYIPRAVGLIMAILSAIRTGEQISR